jgi:hypothetical protein
MAVRKSKIAGRKPTSVGFIISEKILWSDFGGFRRINWFPPPILPVLVLVLEPGFAI